MGTESVRCCKCKLVQFANDSGLCRRCKKSYYGPMAKPITQVVIPVPVIPNLPLQELISSRIKEVRKGRGLSQHEMAEAMGCQRTYISKIENKMALPLTIQLRRFAKALGVPMEYLLLSQRDADECELLRDPFIAQMAALGVTLRPEQRAEVLERAAKMSQVEG